MNCNANHCIRCSVSVQASLRRRELLLSDCIQVGTHEADPTVQQCTDCKSFDRK